MVSQDVPKCCILGVQIAAINMEAAVTYIQNNLGGLNGQYICISNVHTTVMSYEDKAYRKIQNHAVLALPDGKPLSVLSRKRGFAKADRVTGPDLMEEIFKHSKECGYKHYFYGGKLETLKVLEQKLKEQYQLQIAGMYAPPFGKMTEEEDREIIDRINEAKADLNDYIALQNAHTFPKEPFHSLQQHLPHLEAYNNCERSKFSLCVPSFTFSVQSTIKILYFKSCQSVCILCSSGMWKTGSSNLA